MKRSQDIEVLRMASEVQSLQSQVAFYMEKAENSVSREKYEATVAECEAYRNELEALKESVRQKEAEYEAALAAKEDELRQYQEVQALLQTENADFKTLWEFWQHHHFGASSETMTDMMDKVVGKLPTRRAEMLADILSVVDRLNRAGENPCEAVIPQNKPTNEKKEGDKEESGADAKASSGKNCKKTKCLDIREILGPDFGNLPPGFKIIMRDGKPDTIKIEVLFMDKPSTHSKIFTIVRCNVPGGDPMFSMYPSRLFGKIPVDPVFASFCLEMKFGYNIPESRVIEMLGKAGCNISQPTLNRWMHSVMEGLKETLMPAMENAIKESRFTHNDETRILVRSQKKESRTPHIPPNTYTAYCRRRRISFSCSTRRDPARTRYRWISSESLT